MSLASLLQQAKLESAVRYDPQQRALQQLLGQTQLNYSTTLQQAKGTALALQAMADRVRPDVAAIYKQGTDMRNAGNAQAQATLAGLGPGADAFRGALATEHGLATGLGATARSNALNSLNERKLAAQEGAAFAVTNAGNQYLRDAAQIGQQLAGTAADRGTFTAAELQSLRQAERANQVNLQKSQIAAGATVTAAKVRAGGTVKAAQVRANAAGAKSGGRSGAKLLPRTGQNRLQQQVGVAKGWIDRLVGLYGHTKTPHDIRQLLQSGGNVQTGTSTTAAGKTVPKFEKVPAIGDADIINAAYDLHSFGHLSTPNVVRLSSKGFHVPTNWKARGPSAAARAIGSATKGFKGLP